MHAHREFERNSDELRSWLARASDFAVRWLERETRDPVVHAVRGNELNAKLQQDLPRDGMGFDEIFEEFETQVAQHCRANGHPRYFAYVSASADPAGIVAELLAAALNQNVTAWRSSPGAASIERLVIRWLDGLLGFNGGNGVLTGGGSAANFNALAMAVMRAERLGVPRAAMTIHVSEDTHLSIAKAARVLGLSNSGVHILPLDSERRMEVSALHASVRLDKHDGRHPLLIAASAGTANCGAIDDLGAIAELARAENVWLHIDGAYGAPAALTEDHAWLRDAFSQADSLSIDPHKWLYAPLDAGCLLFRDASAARDAFSESAAYTAITQTDPVEAHAFFDHGMELSRRFRALKLWFALKLHGSDAYARAIAGNIALRRYLDERALQSDELELVASGLSISCFRLVRTGMDEADLNELNRSVLQDLLDSGHFLLSPTELDGKFVLRVCMVNFRTRQQDIDALLRAIIDSGERHRG